MRFRRLGAAIAGMAMVAMSLVGVSGATAAVQPSYDTLRVQDGGSLYLYQPSRDWSPLVVPTPDGGAWAFFTAQAILLPTGDQTQASLSQRRLLASRFDPETGVWGAASVMPGGQVSFGPAAAVDANGTVHVVYTTRASTADTDFGVLVYSKSNGDGTWTEPAPVGASETAGHQLAPDILIDGNGGVHVAWQDQRSVDEETRLADAANADVFMSDLGVDGSWSEPKQVNSRPDSKTNASRPQLALDGGRIVAVWSVYDMEKGLDSAVRVEWATRPIDKPDEWSAPKTLIEASDAQIGGRFLDVETNPAGGAVMLFGERNVEDNNANVMIQRLGAGADEWGEPVQIASGQRGSYPHLAVGADGTAYSVYNVAFNDGQIVHVGAIALGPDATVPGGEAILSAGELGSQGIASIAIDGAGRPWVIYFHEPLGGSANEVRVLRSAIISPEPVPVTEAATPVAEATPGS